MQKTKKTNTTALQDVVALWKELKISKGNLEFECGGDSMNMWELSFYDKKNNVIPNTKKGMSELVAYFNEDINKEVEFYEGSDDTYLGEAGDVKIQFVDKKGGQFKYTKVSDELFCDDEDDDE